jgi:hypothetical protein
MSRLTLCAGVAAVAALLASSAHADYLLATYTAPGESASWDQAEAPAPLFDATNFFTNIAVWNYTDSVGGADSYVSYFPTSFGGGWSDGAGDFSLFGAQVYSGSEAAPLFAPGSYAEGAGTLTLTAVPEPAAWAIMLVGLGLVGAVTRGRRRVAAA